ncbi:MAG: hypothetical protein EPO39_15990 [Candidatus Manganitrophaceae bacterium]|nr:MAG: hypothetical protein EPO39_15990 [Candidatus Manganitrophaceae bacterium]
MPLEPLNIPMLWGRIAIAVAALSHALFATFIVGTSVIGALVATIHYRSREARWGRLAHTLAFTLALTTGTISFMGVVLVISLNVFWPHFWSTLFRIMFWPFILEAGFFLGEAIFAYAWYYGWAWTLAPGIKRGLHLSFAWLAAGSSLIAMFMIDMVASYMLTPAPPELFWARLFNPTMIRLDVHRIFGNLVWAGFALAGISAIGLLRAKREEDRAHYQWAGRVFFAIGFGALLVMPFIGFLYMRQIRYTEPQVFFTLMLGNRSWLFDLVALLYGLLIVVGSFYIYKMVKSSQSRPASFDGYMPVALAAVILAAIVFALPYQIQNIPFAHLITDLKINPLGKMQPNKYFAASVLVFVGLVSWIYFLAAYRGMGTGEGRAEPIRPDRSAPRMLIGLAVLSILIYLVMGYSRETARATNGYLIYDMVRLSDEQQTYQGTALARKGR